MGSLWNRSGTIERYGDDLRADGAQAFFFQGGTTTPMSVFADSGETDAYPNPVLADANGRWPDVFVPYVGSYDVQVKSKFGEQLSFSLRIPNPNPVDTTVIIPSEKQVQTGMIHPDFGSGQKAGYVRLNGKTIGDATTSGAGSEMASTDAIDLYRYLWNSIPTEALCPVLPGGRGTSADSDFGLHKTLKLPDMRGAGFAGVDDMGNTPPAGAFGTLAFTAGNSTSTGSILGANAATLTVENMPAHNHTGTTSRHRGHQHNVSGRTTGQRVNAAPFNTAQNHTHLWGSVTGVPGDGSFTTSGSFVSGYDLTHSHTQKTHGALGGTSGGGAAVNSVDVPTSFTGDSGNLDHAHVGSVGGTTSAESDDHIHVLTNAVTTAVPAPPAEGEGAHDHTFTTDTKGGEQLVPSGPFVTRAFNNMPISRLVTWYIKL